jgi:NAD-dependent deacetylase sirtuin 4
MTSLLPPEGAPAHVIARLAERVRGGRVVVLTGAGVSTESGIPDYRSPEALARVRRPITGPDFLRSAAVRRRYWARATAGWERIRGARPGAAHHALAQLEACGVVTCVITQNVDRLHQAAGSREVIELHGALAEVTCLDCGRIEDRDTVQARMREANAAWDGRHVIGAASAPDGDAELPDEATAAFEVPVCTACGGTLKPHVVFFGDNVPRPLVDQAFAAVDEASVLLVAGTSLAVFSGYRFLRRAAERGLWIGVVNRGPVRGEEHAALKIEASTGAILNELARRLSPA